MTNQIDIPELLESVHLTEAGDMEFKSARGGLPGSLWPTYSAMSNTQGGHILLGVEADGSVSGLPEPSRTKQDLWNTLNNRGKVSLNLLAEDDVRLELVKEKSVLVIHVPRATRYQRPVFIGQNPLTGAYRRNFEGDYHCSEEEVGRMLSDRSEEPADSRIPEGFGLEDLDSSSLQQYRQRLSSRAPTHPWLSEDERGLLAKLGGWRRDRQTGREGVTIAGLLMFGKIETIQSPEAVPQFMVDYRERISPDPQVRWTDRLTIDGTWQANLFQFYLKVFQRLSSDVKMPFQLNADLFRMGETIVHEAIREALVNALIHADYRGQGGVVIEKYRDRLELSNPGSLLLSIEQLFRGGVSECRNKGLQQMFLMIGAGEKAGSGIDKIRQGWLSQHWRLPRIQERFQPDRVKIILPFISMMPEETLQLLRTSFGSPFDHLGKVEVQALVTAALEGEVSNARLREITEEHPSDLTRVLQKMAREGFLRQFSQGRWSTYRIPEGRLPGQKDSIHKRIDSIHNELDSIHKSEDSMHKPGSSFQWDSSLRLDEMPPDQLEALKKQAQLAREHSRLKPSDMRQMIETLCAGRYLTVVQLAELLKRDPVALRSRFLKSMVRSGVLQLRYPDRPNRPDQAYTKVAP